MAKIKLEYIWLDGYHPTQNMRSKTKVEEHENFQGTIEELENWSFDGSSTRQASGGSSDCLLKPVAIYPDPARINGYLVMTEVLNADGTAHVSNGRATIDDNDNDFWFGFEQEYFIMDTKTQLPLGFPIGGYPAPQGMYYCSVGGLNTHGRNLVEEHADLCIDAGLNFEGINQEVASGQWEFQLFAKGAKQAGDEIWIARYLLDRLTEKYGYYIDYHPKPLGKEMGRWRWRWRQQGQEPQPQTSVPDPSTPQYKAQGSSTLGALGTPHQPSASPTHSHLPGAKDPFVVFRALAVIRQI